MNRISCKFRVRLSFGDLQNLYGGDLLGSVFMQLQWTFSMDNALALNLVLSSSAANYESMKHKQKKCVNRS